MKILLGGSPIEAILQRLDRLTPDEVQASGTQTLEVVYGLVQHKRHVMDGKNNCTKPVRLINE